MVQLLGVTLPQVIVALLSPYIGGLAERRGRRAALILGFIMLPLRGLLFAFVTAPWLIVLVQSLDGIAGASFGIMVPLIAADTLLISGTDDAGYPPEIGKEMAATIPRARQLVFDAGHQIPAEVPKELNEAILQFLTA